MAEIPTPPDLPAKNTQITGLAADWPQQITNKIVELVDKVRSKTTGPAIHLSRAIVYGLVAVILLVVAFPLFLIGATRGLISLIDMSTTHDKAVWLSYLAIGGFFTLFGVALWSRRPKNAAKG